jgi:hypothetical protein
MATPTFISQYPGVLWLIFSLPRIVAPALLVYIFISSSLGLVAGREFLEGSRWKVAFASALTFPVAFFCSITWRRSRVACRAKSLGATSPPVIAGRLPGSLDIVLAGAKSRFTAYPGEKTFVWWSSRSPPTLSFPRHLLIGLRSVRNRRPRRCVAERKEPDYDVSDSFRGSGEYCA